MKGCMKLAIEGFKRDEALMLVSLLLPNDN